MRVPVGLVALAAGGCYAPSAIEGAPCGAGDACPSGLVCDPATTRCVRTVTPADAAAHDGPADAPADSVTPDASTTMFVDTFSRADSTAVGNGWIEKNPAAFALANNEVTRIDTNPTSYRDNLVYRPASENLLDVEASIDVRFTATPVRYPQIFVRAQTSTITAVDSYDGYLLYVSGGTTSDSVVLGRQLGNVFVETLATLTLSEPLTTTGRYRLTLRAVGTSPVMLTARVDKVVAATTTTLSSTTVQDAATTRITQPGTVGFAGDEFPPYVYDDFRRTAL